MHDQLGDHGVVVHGNLAAVLHAGIHTHAQQIRRVALEHGLRGRCEAHQATGGREEFTERVFRVDAAFNRPAIALHLRLGQRQLLASSHADHQLHQVQAGDGFGHWVLDLQAGVHLQKVKALVLADHKLHRARALVVHGLGQRDCLLAHGFAGRVADKGRWRFFNHLLVAALDRAFALVQIQHIAVGVADQLDLDVARLFDEFFNEHAVIAKTVACLVAATSEAFESLFVVVGHAQPLTAAARAGLDHDGVTDAFGNFDRALRQLNRIVDAGDAVHTRLARQLLGLDLVAHGGNRMVLGADENNALSLTALGELGVLAQKAIAGMDGLRAGGLGSGDDHIGQQITLAAGRRANAHRLVGQRHMARVFVGIGIHGNGGNAHLAGGGNDAAGDFASVGDQDFCEHYCFLTHLFGNCGSCVDIFLSSLGPRRIRLRECPPPALQAPPLFGKTPSPRCDGHTVSPAAKGRFLSARPQHAPGSGCLGVLRR